MHSILHILNTSTELMSAVELMSGAKSRKWVHQKPTNQPTTCSLTCLQFFSYAIYFCFGTPPYFIGTYQKLIFLLAVNNVISVLVGHFRFLKLGE